MPQPETDDDFFEGEEAVATQTKPKGEPKPKPAEPKKNDKFHARYLKDAESLGLSEEEINACKDNNELRELVQYERSKIQEERSTSQQRQVRERTPAPEITTTKPAEVPDDEWEFEDKDFAEKVDGSIASEIKRLGKLLLKAIGGKKKGQIAELTEKIEALTKGQDEIKATNHPLVRRAKKVVEKYPQLFGTEDQREEEPEGRFALQHKWLTDYIFGPMKDQGKWTGVPEKDIPAAIAHLFPGAKPAGKEAQPGSEEQEETPAPRRRQTREEEWAQSGSHPATHRNGVDRSGKPGGRKAAERKAREELKRQGRQVDDDDDDLDTDDEI